MRLTRKVLKSMVSCQKGPTLHAYAWQIGPFWQDALEICHLTSIGIPIIMGNLYLEDSDYIEMVHGAVSI